VRLLRLATLFVLLSLLVTGCQPMVRFGSVVEDLDIPAELYQPGQPGRRPVVILLAPCNGVGAYLREWAGHLQGDGYGVLLVDSYSARGTGNACSFGVRPLVDDVALDAVSAMQFLKSLPWVDRERIAVMGWSHGASAALFVESLADFYGAPPVRAVVSVYPGCETLDTRSHQPTLLLLAGKDDWTPPADCLLAGASMKDEGRPVSIVLYPEASHLYDAPGPMRDYLGHRIGFDASATRDSRLQVSRFLAREFEAR
jgi:dienelactone hydrolase